jgi:teichuronic acid biosynthesis glycosyltransferase TuaH
MSAPTLNARPDWLVIGQEQWDRVERRNQLLIRALAERHPRSRFLFSEIPLRPREIRQWRRPRPRQVAPNIWAIRPIRVLPGARFERFSDRMEARQLRRAMHSLAIERPALWTQDPRAVSLLDDVPAERIVYDLTDDWAAFESDLARRALVQGRIEAIGQRAELVLACSRSLEAGARAWSDRVHYLPNAVDPSSSPVGAPAELQGLPRPLLGYVGTQHASRLDVELLAEAAELRPGWSFVLLGPNELDAGAHARLLTLQNVHHLGVRPHAEIRSFMAALDVGLIPHVVSDFTRSLDPLKLYEYLAAGRPVVATPVGNTADLGDFVAVGATPADFVAACERAVAEDSPELVAQRRAAVAEATWEARAAEVDALLGTARGPASDGRVYAVVVSYNTRELLERCLHTLRAQTGVDVHTIVVDNASTDGSSAAVRERFPEVELIQLKENAGFGPANNVALERCRGDYVLLLNSDAFLEPGSIARLVAVAERHPEAGAIGPRLLNQDGTLQRSAWPFPHAGRLLAEAVGLHLVLRRIGLLEDLGTWAHDEEREVDFVVGACVLLRAKAVAEAGGFDESFWLYGEEADLQRRMTLRGWTVIFTPATAVTHVAGASSAASLPRLRHFYSGQRRFLRKHGTASSWPVARVALLLGSVLRRRWGVVRVALERRA